MVVRLNGQTCKNISESLPENQNSINGSNKCGYIKTSASNKIKKYKKKIWLKIVFYNSTYSLCPIVVDFLLTFFHQYNINKKNLIVFFFISTTLRIVLWMFCWSLRQGRDGDININRTINNGLRIHFEGRLYIRCKN